MKRLIFAILVMLPACAGAQETPEPDAAALAADGRVIAQAQCASCHAIGADGESPNPQAPLFRTVLADLSAEAIEEELIEGIQVAHQMPEFHFNPQGADALIAYLKSIQAPAEQ